MPSVSGYAYPPLLPAGFQEIKLWQLDALFVAPFVGSEEASGHRRYLIDRFRVWLGEFEALGLEADIWLDGSFTTHKPTPGDLDVVVVLNAATVDALPPRTQAAFALLFHDRAVIRARYGCDVYYLDRANEDDLAYWRDVFGRDSRSLHTKGIFHLHVAPRALANV